MSEFALNEQRIGSFQLARVLHVVMRTHEVHPKVCRKLPRAAGHLSRDKLLRVTVQNCMTDPVQLCCGGVCLLRGTD